MVQPATKTEQFQALSERERRDFKHDSWQSIVRRWVDQRPQDYEQLDESPLVDWDDMQLDIRHDDDGRGYFYILTGITHAPGDANAARRRELAMEFMTDYRSELESRIGDCLEADDSDADSDTRTLDPGEVAELARSDGPSGASIERDEEMPDHYHLESLGEKVTVTRSELAEAAGLAKQGRAHEADP